VHRGLATVVGDEPAWLREQQLRPELRPLPWLVCVSLLLLLLLLLLFVLLSLLLLMLALLMFVVMETVFAPAVSHVACGGRRMDTPASVLCAGAYPTVERVCRCDPPSKQQSFGTALSSGSITRVEQFVFSWVLAPGDAGVMNHFWITYFTGTDRGVIIRYYIDGESTASIEFTPSMAAGVGFYDAHAPWGTKWFGKGEVCRHQRHSDTRLRAAVVTSSWR
jgi:hypothetical protein